MTSLALGLTRATGPMMSVGTVSLPSAIDRTMAASSGFSQMLRRFVGTPGFLENPTEPLEERTAGPPEDLDGLDPAVCGVCGCHNGLVVRERPDKAAHRRPSGDEGERRRSGSHPQTARQHRCEPERDTQKTAPAVATINFVLFATTGGP